LWILCVDDKTFEVLNKLDLNNTKLLQLSKLETEELIKVKAHRSKGEYCWTLTPFAPRFVFESDETVSRATYIDADLWFRKNPKPIFDEFDQSEKQVLITDHGYASEHDQSATSGQYCVQFMIFNRHGGELVRKWWEEKCVEWCYARSEDGRFGDQKYLDDWPDKFSQHVHVLKNKELALAPWNATRFPYGNAIFWHFHGLRIFKIFDLFFVTIGHYKITKVVMNEVYFKYLNDFVTVIDKIKSIAKVSSQVRFGFARFLFYIIGNKIHPIKYLSSTKKRRFL
jgi:hypothetical protein